MGLHTLAAAVPTGEYINGYKVIPLVVVLVVWLRLLTWADKDLLRQNMARDRINTGLLVGLIVAFAAFLLLPTFIVAIAVLVAVGVVEAVVFLQFRKQKVGSNADLVLEFKNWVGGLRGKPKEVEEVAGAVQLVGTNGQLLPPPKKETPEAEAFETIQKLLTDPLTNNAEQVDIGPAEGGTMVKYAVDGVSYDGATVAKQAAADALVYLKASAGLDTAEVRKPQRGNIKININGQRREMRLETKGSTAGESARFLANVKGRHNFKPGTLGMTEEQIETWKMVNELGGGITILSTPKGQGLTSLAYGILRGHDSFLQFIQTVERDAEQDLEGITQNKLERGATAEEETKMVQWILSQQPDVLLVTKPESPETAKALIENATGTRRIYVALNAGSTFDALNAWVKLVGDEKLAVKKLQLVINGRPVRKLCEACKQAYKPDAETLRKLNMDPARVTELYQARKEPMRDPKGNVIRCEFCNELRFKGRTGIYEFLLVDEPVVQVATNPMTPDQKASLMKTAFRKQKGKYLQESGLALVEKGETSVQEVLRVLKPPETPGRPSTSKSGGSSRRKDPPASGGPAAA